MKPFYSWKYESAGYFHTLDLSLFTVLLCGTRNSTIRQLCLEPILIKIPQFPDLGKFIGASRLTTGTNMALFVFFGVALVRRISQFRQYATPWLWVAKLLCWPF